MILFVDVVQVFVLPYLDWRQALGIERFKRSQIGAAPVHGDCFGFAVLFNRLLEVAARRGRIPMGTQQEIHGVARLADRAVQVFPLAVGFDVGLIDAPALADRPFARSSLITHQCTLEWFDTSLGHHFFEVTKVQ